MNNYTNNSPYVMGFAHGLRNQQAQAFCFWDSKEDVALYVLGYEAGVRGRPENYEDSTAMKTPEQEPLTEWLVCPKCSYKSPYSPIKAKTLAEDAERITKQTRAALAQQEPVMEYDKEELRGTFWDTTPPKRKEWVGLTGDDMDDITSTAMDKTDAMLLTEAKLKEKNQ